ncbi:MAG: Hpt domain-containing protein [Hyphomicrobiales bacterium]
MSTLLAEHTDISGETELPKLSAPVDLIHLNHYTMSDEGLQREVLQLFCNQVETYVQHLWHAVSQDDWYLAAHTLKGAARSIGAWKVASAAEKAECIKDFDDTFNRTEAFSRVEDAVDEARSFILTMI